MSRHLVNISVKRMAGPAGLCQFGNRRTLRMSLALLSASEDACTGRRAYSPCDDRHHAPHPLVAAQYGLNGGLRPSGKPGRWSRPNFGFLCYRRLRRPAAHPQR
jgi:hypothetical protein